jgi:hypothetical protein
MVTLYGLKESQLRFCELKEAGRLPDALILATAINQSANLAYSQEKNFGTTKILGSLNYHSKKLSKLRRELQDRQ